MSPLDTYEDFVENFLAVPVIKGEKTPSEKFPGAVNTYTIETMTQDRKALQGGTSHFLGQNFAKSCEIKFRDVDSEVRYAWTTSWGATTRLIGAMVMSHGDDDGLVLPPLVASFQIVILPVIHKEETKKEVLSYCHALAGQLRHVQYGGVPLRVIVDEREMRGGDKLWGWVKKGIPLRIEVGPRDIANNQLPMARRDRGHKENRLLSREELLSTVAEELDAIQKGLLEKAKAFRSAHMKKIDTKEEFYAFFTPKNADQEIASCRSDSRHRRRCGPPSSAPCKSRSSARPRSPAARRC